MRTSIILDSEEYCKVEDLIEGDKIVFDLERKEWANVDRIVKLKRRRSKLHLSIGPLKRIMIFQNRLQLIRKKRKGAE